VQLYHILGILFNFLKFKVQYRHSNLNSDEMGKKQLVTLY